MNIPDRVGLIKGRIFGLGRFDLSHDLFVTFLIILTALVGFGLGRLSAVQQKKTPIRIESKSQPGVVIGAVKGVPEEPSSERTNEAVLTSNPKAYVASKNGKKYYFPWCSAVNRIAEENRIWFGTVEEAKAKGYTPASNCKGL